MILPTYNRAYVLWKAISSVLAQTEYNWELIVVDDGSTDNTPRVVEEFNDDRIRYIRSANLGPAAARNTGLAAARAPYVAYLDSDNTWHPAFLATFHRFIDVTPGAVVWFCGSNTTFFTRSEDGRWKLDKEQVDVRRQYTLDEIWDLKAPDTNCMVHAADAAKRVGGWDRDCRWLEDWDFFLRLCLEHPGGWRHVPKVLVEYRQVHGPGSDGICASHRAELRHEQLARAYLARKWLHRRPAIAIRLRAADEDLIAAATLKVTASTSAADVRAVS